jgi:hypothetical protein
MSVLPESDPRRASARFSKFEANKIMKPLGNARWALTEGFNFAIPKAR